MKASTVAALEAINRDFYKWRATEFSDTRKLPWPGWQRVLEIARCEIDRSRISVLDLGCGNGRFLAALGHFSTDRYDEVSYLGVDASWPLLRRAARAPTQTIGLTPELVAGDLVHRPLCELKPAARFDLVVNFGLMHHVPSREARRRLLAASADRLRAGGILAVSFWQFGGRERFRRRFLPWSPTSARVPGKPGGEVDPRDLEEGDHLLAWGDTGAARYCHFTTPEEARVLMAELDLEPLASFRDDGDSRDLNHYEILRKTPSTTVSTSTTGC